MGGSPYNRTNQTKVLNRRSLMMRDSLRSVKIALILLDGNVAIPIFFLILFWLLPSAVIVAPR